jgi:hypothetical protein
VTALNLGARHRRLVGVREHRRRHAVSELARRIDAT